MEILLDYRHFFQEGDAAREGKYSWATRGLWPPHPTWDPSSCVSWSDVWRHLLVESIYPSRKTPWYIQLDCTITLCTQQLCKHSTADMEFVKNFTPSDFQEKNFTPSISPNFNGFSKKKHKKWVKMEKFTPLAKILHCRRHWRHWQIPPLRASCDLSDFL